MHHAASLGGIYCDAFSIQCRFFALVLEAVILFFFLSVLAPRFIPLFLLCLAQICGAGFSPFLQLQMRVFFCFLFVAR